MTESNQILREKLQSIERIATTALASQPHSDEECGEHLRKAIFDIKREIVVESLADVMHEACVSANEDGDDTLCKRYDCPYHGEPNGCNSPTGYFDAAPADSAPMRAALLQLRDGELEFCEKNVERGVGLSQFGLEQHCKIVRGIIESALSALSTPKRNCDRFNSGDVSKDADDALHAILDEGVAGYRSIADWMLSPVKREGCA